ncbi:MAG: hypothetical protein ACR2FS_08090 [Phormidesmis sp.]
MTSSPYQSNLLRFAISQYRRGRDRHRRAVRQARGTATLGVSLGVALTVFPVYALVKASRLAGQRLKQSVNNMRLSGRLFGSDAGTNELIDFSDFDALPTALEPSPNVGPASSSETSLLMAQTLMAVGACLSPVQVKLLRAMRSQSGDLSTGLSTAEAGACMTGRITAIASDLETRSLVLVLGHTLVWRGLSVAQQHQLWEQIARLISGGYPKRSSFQAGTSAAFTPNPTAKVLPGQSRGLMQPVLLFWIEVLKTVAQRQKRSKRFSSRIPKLSSGSGRLSDSSPKPRLAPGPALIEAASNLQCAWPAHRPITSAVKSVGSASTADWEADVLAASYIEHPLEKLLKWVDQILLWLETHWQTLKSWLSSSGS